ncbi:MAG: hypothetical protein ACK5KO_04610 [Arachnia sp.]
MDSDLRTLASQLGDYQAALTAQRQRVAEAHAGLVERFRALCDTYDGTSFREFQAGWRRTEEAFDAYVEGVPPLLDLLSDKVDELRRLDGA